MSSTSIVSGKYNQNWPIVLFFGGLGLLLISAGVYFLTQGGADIALYPGLSGLISLLVAALYFGFQGNYLLFTDSIEGKTRLGGAFSYQLDEVGAVRLGEADLELRNKEGKRLKLFKKVSPDRARGGVWMYHYYHAKMPKDLLAGVGQKASRKDLPAGMRTATRTFSKPGSPTLTDSGLLMQYGDKHYYIPESRTESPGSLIDLISPVIITRYVETPGIPNRSLLPVFQVVRAIAGSSHEEADKFQYLGLLAMTHLGSILPDGAKDGVGDLYETLEDGTQIKIHPG